MPASLLYTPTNFVPGRGDRIRGERAMAIEEAAGAVAPSPPVRSARFGGGGGTGTIGDAGPLKIRWLLPSPPLPPLLGEYLLPCPDRGDAGSEGLIPFVSRVRRVLVTALLPAICWGRSGARRKTISISRESPHPFG